MKMILIWTVLTLVIGFRVKKLDRWTVALVFAACFANTLFAYFTFD